MGKGNTGGPVAKTLPGASRLLTATPRRTWWYVQKPAMFDCACDNCGGYNLDWSEFKGMVWCYDCELDTQGTGGIFSGPIPVNLAQMLGMRFDIYHARLKRVLYFHDVPDDRGRYWSHPPAQSARPSSGGSHPTPPPPDTTKGSP